MNTENLNYLQKQLLNLGFGESLNADLEKLVSEKQKDFTMQAAHDFGGRNVDYQLHFRQGDENPEMYFFNKYDATVARTNEQVAEKSQTFYVNKGGSVTAKEAFNLLEGRAVHKQLYNQEGEKYQAWLQLAKTPEENGNRKIEMFHQNYGYDLEKVLQDKGIKELENEQSKDDLLRSLRKGNAQQITVRVDGQEAKYFIAANPQFKTVNLYDEHMHKLKREVLLEPGTGNKNSVRNQEQRKEELPEKKQRKGVKMNL